VEDNDCTGVSSSCVVLLLWGVVGGHGPSSTLRPQSTTLIAQSEYYVHVVGGYKEGDGAFGNDILVEAEGMEKFAKPMATTHRHRHTSKSV
jgi:hypothetical protein